MKHARTMGFAVIAIGFSIQLLSPFGSRGGQALGTMQGELPPLEARLDLDRIAAATGKGP